MKLTHYVVTLKGMNYTGGIGYQGRILKALGFPPGPYSPAGAKTFVRQAKTVDSKLEFEIHEYIEKA